MIRLNTIHKPDPAMEVATLSKPYSPLQPVANAIERIFASDQEQTRAQKTRSIMGDLVADAADEELELYATEFQNLIDEWLDEFERQAFDHQTLKQVLGQG
ncbi:MAG TPA: hypothetical protein VFT53_01250 [Candidatus Saccharimonadales bacterium]|nr:hypothetical protein [Candidatus Saccharimonadales bacterium]